MDVLSPQLVWVEGRCYRFYESKLFSQEAELEPYNEEEFEGNYDTDNEEELEKIHYVTLPNGKYMHSINIANDFYAIIVGSKGATKKRIESETKTIIYVPNRGKSGDITITGSDLKSIATAKNRINLIIESCRRKLSITHFLSIPMNIKEIMDNFNKFKYDVLTNIGRNKRNICEKVFQLPQKLHITIYVLTLLDETERNEARNILQDCKKEIIDPIINKNGPIKIQLKGVEIMNDDPAESKVLYASVIDKTGICQKLLEEIGEYFVSRGIYRHNNNSKVKMHVTLMNIRYILEKDEDFANIKHESFDATRILEVHKETKFGEMTISSIHLSQRNAYNEVGYYQPTEIIHF